MKADDELLAQALTSGIARLENGAATRRIVYVASGGRAERFDDPEEQVRAAFWAELIYRYGYDPARIRLEVTVPDRVPRDAADIVIFSDEGLTRPFAVIECKRDGISDSEFQQAVEQAAGNGTWSKFRANYVGVVAGLTRRFLDFSDKFGVLERDANIIADLPRAYEKPAPFKYRKGTEFDIQPVSKDQLIATLKKSHQTLWGGGRLSPPAAFAELCKLIFVKVRDENTDRLPGEPYQFQLRTGEAASRLAQRVRKLYDLEQARDPDVFTDEIRVDDEQLRTIVGHLEAIDLSATDLDVKGVAFETFMDSFFKGDFGQYFTPRQIVEFAVRVLKPNRTDYVLDPACGSGGFLLHALDFVVERANVFHARGSGDWKTYWRDFAKEHLFGIEINSEITRVAKMNMILHEDGHSNVVNADALVPMERLADVNGRLREGMFDLILTNPPFGAQVLLAEKPYLATYELAQQLQRSGVVKPRRSQKTEILFIERVHDFLKPGTGKAAIVLPDGLLANATHQYVRDYIVSRFRILAIVGLPHYAFYHFGAGVKSSLVFLQRRDVDETPSADEITLMAQPEHIGYDATGRPDQNDLVDLAEVIAQRVHER